MKELKKYLKDRVKIICSILVKSDSSFTPKKIHTLRIEIKKLKALFELIEHSCKGFKQNSMFKPFKFIFRQAGKVRELYVEDKLLNVQFSDSIPENYKKKLKKFQSKELHLFRSIIKDTSISQLKIIFHHTCSFINKINTKKLNKYLEKDKNRIKNILVQKYLKTSQIHEIRKSLKKIHYNQSSLNMELPQKQHTTNSSLTELLGKWHDYQIIIKHLNKEILESGIDPQELSQLKKIKTKINSESKHLLQTIKSMIHSSEFLDASDI